MNNEVFMELALQCLRSPAMSRLKCISNQEYCINYAQRAVEIPDLCKEVYLEDLLSLVTPELGKFSLIGRFPLRSQQADEHLLAAAYSQNDHQSTTKALQAAAPSGPQSTAD